MQDTNWTTGSLAELVSGRLEGEAARPVEGVASIDRAGPRELTFAADEKRLARLAGCRAAAAIVSEDAEVPDAPMPLIRVANVQRAVAEVLAAFAPPAGGPESGIHPTAVVDPAASLGADVAVGPHVVVAAGCEVGPRTRLAAGVCLGRDVRVGGECRLHEGVVVRHGCTLGERVEIGPNSVIGQDGFGYYFQDGAHHKVPHIGTVVIEDDVEIGACSCVDRAKFGATRIGAGTKIDNLVQIAHNVETGRGCLLAGQVGIAGSARLGDTVVLGGHAGVRDNIRLGDGVQAAAFSAVAGDIEAGQVVGGVPARPVREQMRAVHAAAKTPEMAKKLRDLQARIERLESAADHS